MVKWYFSTGFNCFTGCLVAWGRVEGSGPCARAYCLACWALGWLYG